MVRQVWRGLVCRRMVGFGEDGLCKAGGVRRRKVELGVVR